MLLTIDRVQIATPDAKSAAEMWRRRLGAEQVSADRVRGLGAKRVTLRAGTGEIELLEPEGNGVVAGDLIYSAPARPHSTRVHWCIMPRRSELSISTKMARIFSGSKSRGSRSIS